MPNPDAPKLVFLAHALVLHLAHVCGRVPPRSLQAPLHIVAVPTHWHLVYTFKGLELTNWNFQMNRVK